MIDFVRVACVVLGLAAAVRARADGAEWTRVRLGSRVGAEFTSIAIDPRDPQHVLLGTTEGEVLMSADGGVTWETLPIHNRLVDRDGFHPGPVIWPPSPWITPNEFYDSGTLTVFNQIDPLFAASIWLPRTRFLNDRNYYQATPTRVAILNYPPFDPDTALETFTLQMTDEEQSAEGVVQVTPCGGRYAVLAATPHAIYGYEAAIGGFIRLWYAARTEVYGVHCSGRVVVGSTDDGPVVSQDGGLTFADSPYGGAEANLSAAAVDTEGRIALAIDEDVWAVHPDGTVSATVPARGGNDSAPWSEVRSIALDGSVVWIGTEDGLRVSRDGGATYEAVERAQFAEQHVISVVAGAGKVLALLEQCAAERCRGTRVIESADGGRTWHHSFEALTRRTARQIGIGSDGRRWIVAGHEVWATIPPRGVAQPRSRRVSRWAERRLRDTPDLDRAIASAQARAGVDAAGRERAFGGLRARAWLPELRVDFRHSTGALETQGTDSYLDGNLRSRFQGSDGFGETWLLVTLRFSLPDAMQGGELEGERRRIVNLAREVAFMVEDAWSERRTLLEQLRGRVAPLDAAVARARIRMLEALLSHLCGPSMFGPATHDGENL